MSRFGAVSKLAALIESAELAKLKSPSFSEDNGCVTFHYMYRRTQGLQLDSCVLVLTEGSGPLLAHSQQT
jgi:hypothetical protein